MIFFSSHVNILHQRVTVPACKVYKRVNTTSSEGAKYICPFNGMGKLFHGTRARSSGLLMLIALFSLTFMYFAHVSKVSSVFSQSYYPLNNILPFILLKTYSLYLLKIKCLSVIVFLLGLLILLQMLWVHSSVDLE